MNAETNNAETEEQREQYEKLTDNSEFERPAKEELEPPVEETAIELPHVLELDFPVALTKNKTVEEIIFRNRISGIMMEHLPVDTGDGVKMKFGHFLPLIAGMTGETMQLMRKMDRKDLLKAVDVVTSFL